MPALLPPESSVLLDQEVKSLPGLAPKQPLSDQRSFLILMVVAMAVQRVAIRDGNREQAAAGAILEVRKT